MGFWPTQLNQDLFFFMFFAMENFKHLNLYEHYKPTRNPPASTTTSSGPVFFHLYSPAHYHHRRIILKQISDNDSLSVKIWIYISRSDFLKNIATYYYN